MRAKGDPNYPLRPEIANVDGPMREPVAKLGKLVTDRIPIKLGLQKITKDDPEYWAVARLCTDEEAELALKFGGIRKPKTFAQLKKISGIEDTKLQEMLEFGTGMLNITVGELASAYELLELKRYKPILDNIIYMGLSASVRQVREHLSGQKSGKKTGLLSKV